MVARRFAPGLAAFALLAACGGAAPAATHGYGVTSFDKIRVDGPFDIHVHVGGAPGARATGPQAAIDRLSVEQHDDILVIKPLPGGWGGWPGADQGKLAIEVTTPSLAVAGLSGSGNLSIDRIRGDTLRLTLAGSGNLSVGATDVTELAIVVTGSGDMTLAGRARRASATLTGSGNLRADALATDDATVNLVGSGDLAIGAGHNAKVNLAGSGDVRIVGPANCAVTRSGSGNVKCAHIAAN
ncbi:MAG TPA: head GIN domain-containing protein [Sphingomonas sp.]